jgi:hypothetical protein
LCWSAALVSTSLKPPEADADSRSMLRSVATLVRELVLTVAATRTATGRR